MPRVWSLAVNGPSAAKATKQRERERERDRERVGEGERARVWHYPRAVAYFITW
jgi:hypothetical protein